MLFCFKDARTYPRIPDDVVTTPSTIFWTSTPDAGSTVQPVLATCGSIATDMDSHRL
jgi:hypothetical protein